MNFERMNLNQVLLDNIKELGYNEPTEIQSKVIPIIKEYKDVVALAETGSGKTAAFALPLLERLMNENNPDKVTRVLILTPTRELAVQIRDNIMAFRKGTEFKCSVILGGINKQSQKAVIKRGFEILVATPGRLVDLLNQRKINLNDIRTVVLDEADTMLDMGFIHDIDAIISKTPKKRQTLLFSATIEDSIKNLTNKIMNNPIYIKLDSKVIKNKINQEVYYISKDNKSHLLLDLISTKEKLSTIIFTRTKEKANELENLFKEYNIKVSVLHGDKQQSNRMKAMKDFKEGKVRFLIATDIAARGIDIDNLGLVINYDVPEKKELYVHRVGRTARNGLAGKAITLCAKNERDNLEKIEKSIGLTLPRIKHKYESKEKVEDNNKNNRLKQGNKFKTNNYNSKNTFKNKQSNINNTDRNYSKSSKRNTISINKNNKTNNFKRKNNSTSNRRYK